MPLTEPVLQSEICGRNAFLRQRLFKQSSHSLCQATWRWKVIVDSESYHQVDFF